MTLVQLLSYDRLTIKVIVEIYQQRKNAAAIGIFHEATLHNRKKENITPRMCNYMTLLL